MECVRSLSYDARWFHGCAITGIGKKFSDQTADATAV